ncbi:MAG: hypothetical protein MUD14_18940 [Hydrococcus sp. Prado102]|jgi:hypothetical protein|nr:hypothetical protein [Hydrococcus sp. Prado102]
MKRVELLASEIVKIKSRNANPLQYGKADYTPRTAKGDREYSNSHAD